MGGCVGQQPGLQDSKFKRPIDTALAAPPSNLPAKPKPAPASPIKPKQSSIKPQPVAVEPPAPPVKSQHEQRLVQEAINKELEKKAEQDRLEQERKREKEAQAQRVAARVRQLEWVRSHDVHAQGEGRYSYRMEGETLPQLL